MVVDVVVCGLESSDNGLRTQNWVEKGTLVAAITGTQAFVSKTGHCHNAVYCHSAS